MNIINAIKITLTVTIALALSKMFNIVGWSWGVILAPLRVTFKLLVVGYAFIGFNHLNGIDYRD